MEGKGPKVVITNFQNREGEEEGRGRDEGGGRREPKRKLWLNIVKNIFGN